MTTPSRLLMFVAILALPLAACGSQAKSQDQDAAPDAGAAICAEPDGGDLTPHFAFSADDRGAFPPRAPCDATSADRGPADGGDAPPPGSGTGPDDATVVPPPALNPVANEYGTNADVVLPGTQQSILADDFRVILDTNGRQCETCHGPDYSWSTTPAAFQGRFEQGLPYFSGRCDRYPTNETATRNDDLEPVFRKRDASNSPVADLSTPAARRQAYSLLLARAVIRIGLPVPADADFELVAVDDPYGFASAKELSLFRRSPPMANLRFSPAVMWDGRENRACEPLITTLARQAEHAITGHAEGTVPSHESLQNIVDAEVGLYVAQLIHNTAGQLNDGGAHGGPYFLAQVPFYPEINAFDRADPRGRAYSAEVFTLYAAWRALPADTDANRARAQIAEGERLFNNRLFTIRGASGFNDQLGRGDVTATCGACHDAPNVGTSSEGRFVDIGISSEENRAPELPLYSFRAKATGAVRRTADPGRALVSGRWSDLDCFKVPSLRALAGRAPYFHDGSAPSLEAVIEYHDRRFAIHLTPDEKTALVMFLSAL
jgi:cytochrome c peroxidase